MRLGLSKFTQPFTPISKPKPTKKLRSRLKYKNQVTVISNTIRPRRQQLINDLSQVLLTTRRNFMNPSESSRIQRSTQVSRLAKSLTRDVLPVPTLNLKIKSKKKYKFFDDDRFYTQRTLPMICKTNLREQIQIKQIQYTTPNITKINNNPQQTTIEIKPFMVDEEYEMNSKDLEPYTGFYSDNMNRILGNVPTDMITKRFKALNSSLLRPQKMYYGKKFRSKDIVEWKK